MDSRCKDNSCTDRNDIDDVENEGCGCLAVDEYTRNKMLGVYDVAVFESVLHMLDGERYMCSACLI